MSCSYFARLRNHLHQSGWLYISFFWCFGLSFGMLFGYQRDTSQYFGSQFFRPEQGSFPVLFFVNACPLLFSILLIRFRMTAVLFPVVFLKSFLLGFTLSCFVIMFGSAGWLTGLLMGFSGLVNAVLMLYLWFVCSGRAGRWCLKFFLAILILSAFACLLDCYIISPLYFSIIV